MKKQSSLVVGNRVKLKAKIVTNKVEPNADQEPLYPAGVQIETAAKIPGTDIVVAPVEPSLAWLKDAAQKIITEHDRGLDHLCHLLEFSEKGFLKFSRTNEKTNETKTFKANWKFGKLGVEVDFTNMIQINNLKQTQMDNEIQHLYPAGQGPDSDEKQEKQVSRCDMINHIINNSAQWTEADLEQKEISFIVNLFKSIQSVDYSLNSAGRGSGKAAEDENLLLPTSTEF